MNDPRRHDSPDLTIDAPVGEAGSIASGEMARRGPPSLAAPGQRFADRYEIVRELGRGGMGVVYAARDAMLGGEDVALKILFADASAPTAIERFRREVRLARRITSPFVARTHDLGEHAGVFYLTMELVSGESLASRIARLHDAGRRMDHPDAVRIARAIAAGLSAAHAADVVHRDLKPDNVLLADPDRVLVTDFGIARAFRGPEAIRATVGIAGTPAYMAPEQLEGKPTDARTDLYALGVVLYECLTGSLPFFADTPIAAALLRLHQPPRAIDPALGLPPPLAKLMLDLLARDPDARPASAEAVIARLDVLELPAVSGNHATVMAASPPVVAPTPSSTRSSARADVGLVVMPFEHRGPAEEQGTTSSVRTELIDVLSRTQGIRVVGRGTVDGLSATDSDVRSFESRFGARFAIDASVQVAAGGQRLRASVRMLEVATGVQVFSEAVELSVADPFVAAERLAYKLAELIRLALEVSAYEGKVSREVLDLYRQARKAVRGSSIQDPTSLLAQLERAIASAPGWAPPIALTALAYMRLWIVPQLKVQRDWHGEARLAVERANLEASHLAETRFASAQLAWHETRLDDAVREARAALALAPAFPDVIAFLGQLELEVSRPEEGLERLAIARDLEPSLRIAVLDPARWHGLYGDLDTFRTLIDRIRKEYREDALAGQNLVRAGAWRGDEAMVREGIQLLSRLQHPVAQPLIDYGRAMLGEHQPTELPAGFLSAVSPRLRTVVFQMQAETWGKLGDREKCLGYMLEAADLALTDLEWVDKCPLFVGVRDDPRFDEVRRKVVARCEQIWLGA